MNALRTGFDRSVKRAGPVTIYRPDATGTLQVVGACVAVAPIQRHRIALKIVAHALRACTEGFSGSAISTTRALGTDPQSRALVYGYTKVAAHA